MEERMSWGEAISTGWGNLTGVNDEGSARSVRFLFILIFIGGIAYAGYNLFRAQTAFESQDHVPSNSVSGSSQDEKRLSAMVDEVRVTSDTRKNSTYLVDSMQTVARYPFRDSSVVMVDNKPTEIIPDGTVIPDVVIEMPPEVTLRAIMYMNRSRVAIMDIAGVGTGMVVRQGDTFLQRKGRILRILSDKVVVRWGGRNWDIAPSF